MLQYEDQTVRQSSGGVMQGLGVRVVEGDSVGYAYSDDFTFESMRQAASTAAQIAHSQAGQVDPVRAGIDSGAVGNFYPVEKPSVDARALEKLELIRRTDRAARAYDPAVTKVNIIFSDQLKRIMVASSDGRLVADLQPL